MIDILQVIGTRPQYEKLIRFKNDFVIDTGQHYSKSLLKDKGRVDVTLPWEGIREAVKSIAVYVKQLPPKLIVVYGDTFSTFAGALAAKRCNIPLAHIEAGVPYIKGQIESKIRNKVDILSDFSFCPTKRAYENIDCGWHGQNIMFPVLRCRICYLVGDLMYDSFIKENIKCRTNVTIATIHRRENLPNLKEIFKKLDQIEYGKVWFFTHPHTREYMKKNKIKFPKNFSDREPCSHEDMLAYLKNAKRVVTDSGGLVREAYWSGVPFEYIGENPWPETRAFGDGHAGDKIRRIIEDEIIPSLS